MNWYKTSQIALPETSVNINIYPQEPIVKEVVDEIERENPGYFQNLGIKEIRLNTGGAEFGHVEYNPQDTEKQQIIFLEYNNIKRAVENATGVNIDQYNPNMIPPQVKQYIETYIKQQIKEQVGKTITHEKGHLSDLYQSPVDSPFTGGESAAEQETRQMGFNE